MALEPLADALGAISQALALANEQIESHNATVANLGKEKQQLASQVWKHIVAIELAPALQGMRLGIPSCATKPVATYAAAAP
ncbi:hypothetical protein [Ectopseudomonas oleovorans]|uniref:hypothetical protein n=1 Tax=Ectopseudomonas oleovorans TaxID=301 RepID=UPI0031345B88